MSSYVACKDCGRVLDVTGKIKVKCMCEWEYTKVLTTKHPKFEVEGEKIQVGYGG